MAIANNPLVKGMRGSLNKQLVYRDLHGKTVVSAYPDMSDQKFSGSQKANQKVMVLANEYAQKIRRNEELRNQALVRLNVTRSKLYTSLVREYFAMEKLKGKAS